MIECVGIDRILEALESHMWEGLIRINNNNKINLTEDEDDDGYYKELYEGRNKSYGTI